MIGLFSYGTWQLCSFKKRYIQIIIICLILVSIFGLNIAIRISYGYRRIAAFNTKIEEPKVLRGMYVTPPMAEVYKTINRSLIDALKENSFPYLVNLTWDPIYSTFISSQKNFHPMYIFSNNNDFIYPNFRNLRNEFISTKHPLVLWYEGSNVPGWSCVKVFNIIDSGKYILTRQKQKNRIALYRFTGSDKIP